MKKAILSVLIVSFLSSFALTSLNEVVSAIRSGNAAEVAKYFDNTVEITIAQKTNSYSKKQAELVLNDFFQNNNVKSFEVIHQSENSASQYCIGNLTTNTGVYRTTIYMKQTGNKQVIQELRFEK